MFESCLQTSNTQQWTEKQQLRTCIYKYHDRIKKNCEQSREQHCHDFLIILCCEKLLQPCLCDSLLLPYICSVILLPPRGCVSLVK